MKRRLALWAARKSAADRLARGSATVWQRRADALTSWVRAGRRDDLTGWRAALGPVARLAILGVLAYAVWAVIRALPWLMWLLAGWWLRAAWKAGRAPAEETDDAPADEASSAAGREALRGLLLKLMGEGSGVHLRTVLAHLQEHGQWEGRTVTDLRLQLGRLGVPHDPRVKVGGVPTWGVRRRDLEAPSPAAAEEASTASSTAA
ncbi:hypothetical protein ACFFKE_32345 [Streptomyces mutabilis]|uniref:hypothetical protein n=1 Tax=Streptomyces mutabilis TaxID=67332 RepID=UPI00177FAF2F|nr:hypothetical protein [Streptomyces mutabilis]GGQ38505.1 hypothetical protein GCM10010279_54760 [Streptomyces mutabilis]